MFWLLHPAMDLARGPTKDSSPVGLAIHRRVAKPPSTLKMSSPNSFRIRSKCSTNELSHLIVVGLAFRLKLFKSFVPNPLETGGRVLPSEFAEFEFESFGVHRVN